MVQSHDLWICDTLQELEQRVYDIILMDVHMPIIDGLEASRQIRDTYPPEERPKIVALSADTTQVCPTLHHVIRPCCHATVVMHRSYLPC